MIKTGYRSISEAMDSKSFAKMYRAIERDAERGSKRAMEWLDSLDQEMMKYLPGLSDDVAKDFNDIKDQEAKKNLYDRASMLSGIDESFNMSKATSDNYEYKLVVSNNTSSFWNPKNKKVQYFNKIDDVLKFMCRTGLTTYDSDMYNRILKEDKKKNDGRIMSTSWYDLYKGEDQMTGYTSF